MFAFKYTFLLVAVLGLAASAVRAAPRITESLVVDAPPDFVLKDGEDLRRLASFPSSPIASIDNHGGPLDRPRWFKLRLERGDSDPVDDLWLRMAASTQRHAEAHLTANGRLLAEARAGFRLPPEQRVHPTVRLLLPLSSWKTTEAVVYVQSDASYRLPLNPALLTSIEVEKEGDLTLSLMLSYVSGVFFLLIVQIVLYLHFREPAGRDYILVTLSFLLLAFARSGYFDLHFGGYLGGFFLSEWGSPIRLLPCPLVIRAFASFFNFKECAPWLHRTLKTSERALLAVFVLSLFVPGPIGAGVAPAFLLYTMMLVVTACVVAIRARLLGAVIISVGWSGILLVGLYLNLVVVGIITGLPHAPAPWLSLVAALWELLFNTFGLTQKFRHLAEIRRQKELRELEAAGLERMVRVLCHDVSTPLATIGMTTDLVELNQQAGRPVDLAATNRRLREAFLAIKEIVDSARNVELVKLHGGVLPREPVDLCAVFADAERMMQEKLARKRISVRRIAWPEQALVLAEPRLLRLSVIANALSNAIKFSRPGTTIDAEIRHKGRDVILRIRDHGVGIPAEMRETFARSGRINSRPGTMNEEGTGFGVLLMRDFTQAMGGSFRLESRTTEESPSDHGTTVEIILRAPGAA